MTRNSQVLDKYPFTVQRIGTPLHTLSQHVDIRCPPVTIKSQDHTHTLPFLYALFELRGRKMMRHLRDNNKRNEGKGERGVNGPIFNITHKLTLRQVKYFTCQKRSPEKLTEELNGTLLSSHTLRKYSRWT